MAKGGIGGNIQAFIFGGLVGALGLYAMQNFKGGISLNLQPTGMKQSMAAYGGDMIAESNYALTDVGRFGSSTAYNNSEVWDIRNRKDKNDDYMSNTLPYIPKTSISDWNPNRLKFIGSRIFDCGGSSDVGATGWIGHSGI